MLFNQTKKDFKNENEALLQQPVVVNGIFRISLNNHPFRALSGYVWSRELLDTTSTSAQIEVCPMLPEQRLEYAACEEAVRAATPTGKPSPAMLQVFEVR